MPCWCADFAPAGVMGGAGRSLVARCHGHTLVLHQLLVEGGRVLPEAAPLVLSDDPFCCDAEAHARAGVGLRSTGATVELWITSLWARLMTRPADHEGGAGEQLWGSIHKPRICATPTEPTGALLVDAPVCSRHVEAAASSSTSL